MSPDLRTAPDSSQTPVLPPPTASWEEWMRFGLAWSTPRGRRGEDRAQRPSTQHPLSGAMGEQRSLRLHAYREATPGPSWKALFETTWPAYRSWYTARDLNTRPTLDEAQCALKRHMPELVAVWERLVALTGADPMAARMLTMWRMPAFAGGCSQVVVPGPLPLLVRNYDYDLRLFEGVVASTDYSGRRKVLGTSDLLWGLLDGMNEDGLAVSLTLGGRPGSGDGFGIPIVIRYLLETCTDVDDAIAVLRRIPVAQAYNISLVDTGSRHATVYVAPGEAAEVSDLDAATNHRRSVVEYPEISGPLRSSERQQVLFDALADHSSRGSTAELVDTFTQPPLRTTAFDSGFGTLYTAAYRPADGTVSYHWPGQSWTRHFDDDPAHVDVTLPQGE